MRTSVFHDRPKAVARRRFQVVWLTALLAVFLPGAVFASGIPATEPNNNALRSVIGLVNAGQFRAADAQIDAALRQSGLSAATRQAFEYQRVRMKRMRLDFSLSAAQVKAQARKQAPGITDAQFERWDAHGLVEHMYINGELRYFNRSPRNLFELSAEARKLRLEANPHFDDASKRRAAEEEHYALQVIHQAQASGHSSVLPQRLKVTHTVTVDADAVPAGKTVRAWIPYPRNDPGQQEDIRFVASQPSAHRIAPESALQRTVYLEKKAQAGKPTVFSITYEVTLYAQYHAIDPDKVVKAKITPELAPYVAERAPHIVFTQPLRVLSRQVVGNATNPYRIAQRIYAAVDQVPWVGSREYSTISDLSAYTLRNGSGDCGRQTLLMMTLMRMNGIPARWQSGWTFTKGKYSDIHDWAEIYLAPYGWVPVDVTYGQFDSGNPALRWFYLGGLDNYRIAFNDGFSHPFVPAKHSFRSDTVDNQRGEVEWDGGNLYYNQWSHHFDWQFLPLKQH